MKKNKALLILNLQNDYCDGGPMAIPGTLKIIPEINRIRKYFDIIIFIKDWYPDDHISFLDHNKYLKHCIQNTKGAELNSGFIIKDSDYIVNKNTLIMYDSDSAFYDAKLIEKKSKLDNILKINKIKQIYLCGGNIETTIFSTALDAIYLNYECYIITDLAVGKIETKKIQTYEYLKKIGVKLIKNYKIKN